MWLDRVSSYSVDEDEVDLVWWEEVLNCFLPLLDAGVLEISREFREHTQLTGDELECLSILQVDSELIIHIWLGSHSPSWWRVTLHSRKIPRCGCRWSTSVLKSDGGNLHLVQLYALLGSIRLIPVIVIKSTIRPQSYDSLILEHKTFLAKNSFQDYISLHWWRLFRVCDLSWLCIKS